MTSETNISAGDSSWYENISVFESDYVPDTFAAGSSVETNHDLLSAWRNNEFEITEASYTLGLVTLLLVFLVSGVLACILLPCLYHCLGKSRKERLRERLQFGRQTHYKGNILMVIASVAAVATAVGAVWGLQKADSGLTNIEDHTQDVATDLNSVLNLPTQTTEALDELSAAYEVLTNSFGGCLGGDILAAQLNTFDLNSFISEVQADIQDLDAESLSDLADDVQGVSDAVEETEGVRKGLVWPVLILALLFTVVFVVVGVGTYECVAFGFSDCGGPACCIAPCTIFVAVVVWLCAAAAVTLSALSGDFCIDPDTHTEDLINQNAQGDIAELIIYYTGDCTTQNDAVDAIIAAQEVAVPTIQAIIPSLYLLAEQCDDLVAPVESIDASLESLWDVLEEGGELSSCENLNSKYQSAVYDELCEELPKGLLGFWVSCAILTVLLLILVVQWNRMLGQQRTEDVASRVEAMRPGNFGRMVSSWRMSRRNVTSEAAPSSEMTQRPVVVS